MMDAFNTSTPDALLTLGKVALLLMCVGIGWRLGGWVLARHAQAQAVPAPPPASEPEPDPEPEPEPPAPEPTAMAATPPARRQALRLASGDVAWSDPHVQELVSTRRWRVIVGGRAGGSGDDLGRQGCDESTDPGDEQEQDEEGGMPV